MHKTTNEIIFFLPPTLRNPARVALGAIALT